MTRKSVRSLISALTLGAACGLAGALPASADEVQPIGSYFDFICDPVVAVTMQIDNPAEHERSVRFWGYVNGLPAEMTIVLPPLTTVATYFPLQVGDVADLRAAEVTGNVWGQWLATLGETTIVGGDECARPTVRGLDIEAQVVCEAAQMTGRLAITNIGDTKAQFDLYVGALVPDDMWMQAQLEGWGPAALHEFLEPGETQHHTLTFEAAEVLWGAAYLHGTQGPVWGLGPRPLTDAERECLGWSVAAEEQTATTVPPTDTVPPTTDAVPPTTVPPTDTVPAGDVDPPNTMPAVPVDVLPATGAPTWVLLLAAGAIVEVGVVLVRYSRRNRRFLDG